MKFAVCWHVQGTQDVVKYLVDPILQRGHFMGDGLFGRHFRFGVSQDHAPHLFKRISTGADHVCKHRARQQAGAFLFLLKDNLSQSQVGQIFA